MDARRVINRTLDAAISLLEAYEFEPYDVERNSPYDKLLESARRLREFRGRCRDLGAERIYVLVEVPK